MRTGRSLTVLGGVCSRGGACLLLVVVSAPEGVCYGGMSAPGRVSAPGGVCLPLVLGGYIPSCNAVDTHPPANRMTDACENITLATTACKNA